MTGSPEGDPASLVGRLLVAPLRRFLAVEAASGILLVTATVVALSWANLGSSGSYERFWSWHLDASWAGPSGRLGLHDFVNDALMALFFFVVGLEIKHEWLRGALRDRRFARLPIVAAIGGMVVPAGLYLAFAGSTSAGHGWGIPMATDIAFVVGVMALLGSRVPAAIKVFLLTLAIVDDLGSIVVIAVFYASGVRWGWLAAAVAGVVGVVGLRRARVRAPAVFVALAVAVWYCTWQSGVHATIAGVALAFVTPFESTRAGSTRSPADVLLERLHPWSSFVVVPLFALANAGVALGGEATPGSARITLGIVVGLVVGKSVGVTVASWGSVRIRWAVLPDGVRWPQLAAAAMLAGIGFTMSLFITDLAFSGHEAALFADAAKRAILLASVVAALAGSAAFVVLARRRVEA